MKNLLATLLVSGLMVSAAESVTATELTVNVLETSNKELKMFAKNASGSELKLQIIDDENRELLSMVFDAQYLVAKKLNLKYLPSGSYSLKVSDDDEIVIIPIRLSGLEASAMINDLTRIEKVQLVATGQKVFMNLNKTAISPVKLLIYDSNGDLVHQERYQNVAFSMQTFDFRTIGNDTYEFVIYYPKAKYSQYVAIK